jgi:hypothetical protein
MSIEYPDILGDLVDARRRFEVNGVHFVLRLEPDRVDPGEATAVRIWLQSCWDVPVQVKIHLNFPSGHASDLSVIQERTDVPLSAGEVGELSIPVSSAADLAPGEYPVRVTVGVTYEVRGLYVRSQESEGHFGDALLTFTTGMSLSTTMGLGFTTRTQPEHTLLLRVSGEPRPGLSPDLTPTFICHWTVDELPIQGKARHHVNDQRLFFLPNLTRQALYRAFLDESQTRYRNANLPLHLAEALFLAKILTFTAEYFLRRPDRQDVILIPAYTLAFRYNLPTDDPVFLVARADYARLARLACALTFGLLRQKLKRDVWTVEEQLAVTDLIADRVERGGVLSAEFLYLPLLLGGLMISSQLTMPGENPAQSLALLAQARKQRSTGLAENEELTALLDSLLQPAS